VVLSGSGATCGQLKKSIFRSVKNAMFSVQAADPKTNNTGTDSICVKYIDHHYIDVLEQDESHP